MIIQLSKPNEAINRSDNDKRFKTKTQEQQNKAITTTIQERAYDYLSLNEIAPRWSSRLEKHLPFVLSFTWLNWYYEIRQCSKCIVGEAYGFSSSYTKTCKECDRFSVRFLRSFIIHSYSKVQKNKVLFVDHWNEHHRRSNNKNQTHI
jgi:hypothetical protein